MMNQIQLNHFNLSDFIRPEVILPALWIVVLLALLTNLSVIWPQLRLATLLTQLVTVEGIMTLLENLLSIL